MRLTGQQRNGRRCNYGAMDIREQAIAKLMKQCDAQGIESPERGWLLQFAARIALDWGKKEHALELQQRAFADNRNLSRPKVGVPNVQIVLPGSQAKAYGQAAQAIPLQARISG